MSLKFKKAVEYFAKLQGVGPRQATRIVVALLGWPKEEIAKFSEVVFGLAEGINLCQDCFNLSEESKCQVCSDPKRDQSKICVVEKITDLGSIEKTGLYRGLYHVLGGAIDPVEGLLPRSLRIKELLSRVENFKKNNTNGQTKELEVILATNPNTQGETTALYLEEILRPTAIKTSRLAKGLSSGSYLEYVDSITLQNAFKNRR
ncbi:MAG: recombination protein RecR [Candidatus Yanofskybacteria bacterium]|nr:recombination protein RecR [Candidatus Yanofskybacteria bacterium]